MEKGVKSRQPAMSVSLSNSLRVKGLCEEHNTLAHDVPWARRRFPKDSTRTGLISDS